MNVSNGSKINNKEKCLILITLGSLILFMYTIYNIFGEINDTKVSTNSLDGKDIKNYYSEVKGELKMFGLINSSLQSTYLMDVSYQDDLTIRQLCSVESAAKNNPSWMIYILLVGPLKIKGLWKELEKYHNVKTEKIDVTKYTEGSPVDNSFLQDLIHANNRPQYLSTVLKLITLYKYGGIAAELDMIFARPFDELKAKNWFAKERTDVIGTGIFGLTKDEIAKNISEIILRQLRSRFYDSELMVRETLKKILLDLCQVAEFNELSGIACDGFEIFDSDYFYPLQEWQSNAYYKPGNLNNQYAFVYHTWHEKNRNLKIDKDSPYVKLAIKYCPNTYMTHINIFDNKTNI